MGVKEHQAAAASISVRCAIITLSDTRTLESDRSGMQIADLLQAHGHSIVDRQVIADDANLFTSIVRNLLLRADVDAVLTTGGTGVSRRDQTINAMSDILELPLPGFGELFRVLSFQQIGSAAMLSRAVGGIAKGKVLFTMPGSTKAVDLAMTQLILPQIRHILHELRK